MKAGKETKEHLKNSNSAGLAGWLIGGVALGASIALLIAPQTGKKTRKLLRKSADKGGKSLLESGQEIFEKGRELFERGREIAEQAAEALEKNVNIAEKKFEERF